MKTFVYDFDKTLTKNDTLLQFFLYCVKKNILFPVKLLCYFFCVFLKKSKLITLLQLKNIGIYLFIFPLTLNELYKKAQTFVNFIKFNKVYYDHFYKYLEDNNVIIIIVSASFELYLKLIFPKCKVIGTTLIIENNHVKKIDEHCYEKNKLRMLNNNGVSEINTFITDNLSDIPLLNVAKKSYLVIKGDLIRYK